MALVTKISEHISLKEATRSSEAEKHGIRNFPNQGHLASMKALALKVFEPLRAAIGKPIRVNSFYRSPSVNKLIKGASLTSQHCLGEAIDISATEGFTNKDIFSYIVSNLDFDQVIWEAGTDSEPDWVHVSYKTRGNRKQILQMKRVEGKPTYIVHKDLSFIVVNEEVSEPEPEKKVSKKKKPAKPAEGSELE
jgi:hypothetical protein